MHLAVGLFEQFEAVTVVVGAEPAGGVETFHPGDDSTADV
jgi:hypothetical protein